MKDRDRITRTRARASGAEDEPTSKAVHYRVCGHSAGTTVVTARCTKGEDKPVVGQRMPGAGLS